MNNSQWIYLIYFGFLYAGMILLYIMIARKLQLTDVPSLRSSHKDVTITGAGFIFPIAFFLPLAFTGEFIHYRSTLTGLLLISLVSFSDDLKSVHPIIRVTVQVIAVSLLLWQTGGLFKMKTWQIVPGFILVVGIINSYNFMDGINGMNALYSIAMIGILGILRVNGIIILPVPEVFYSLMSALLAFSLFNVRKKALCFSGDVGSISIAYIVSLMIIQVMIATDSSVWILLFGVYGLDSVGTIVLRIIRGEKVWMPHRTHFYQYLVNERKWPHVQVSLMYASLQFLLSFILYKAGFIPAIIVFLLYIAVYIWIRLHWEGSGRLFGQYFKTDTNS
ncbi:MAG: glycosyl transferase family 4 [Chitinophagaceae bacterium]|jgi:UDP-GlcNAc:undecaprenyl-phosphate GlcNAc-1-phosphate transferase|nr:glycosyl transferase family 4 [Chitinophagaceae bacterium]